MEAELQVIEARAQAAAWLARLRSEERRPEDEAGFRAWLAESEVHRRAFDGINTVWEAAGALPRTPRNRRAESRRAVLASVAALVVGAGSLGAWRLATAGTYETAVGEQRRVALDDGSLIILDTNSKIRVDLGKERRSVELVRGRAHFEVVRDARRPFVVDAAGRQVVAVGTAFDVQRDRSEVCVLVTKGEVAVFDLKRDGRQTLPHGARMTLTKEGAQVDRPDLARVTAWQQGRAVFDNDTVADAVAEMNRYSRRPIVIEGDQAAQMHVSGVYATGDTEAFAKSLATLLPLKVDLAAYQVTISAQNSS